ncbi:MAG: nucleoside:proton symporter [Burkholderiales bacterium]|jgi:CNT family concentrative nucleoside transporter|nr:nucleoside:proton symporter [Burkholderiales bacterium]
MQTLHALFGCAGLLLLCWLLSEQRRAVRWRTVGSGLALAFALALGLLHLPPLQAALALVNEGANALQHATQAGTAFVFGHLGGGPLPYAETAPGASFVLAFRVLPLVLVVAALSALLFHWRLLPLAVRAFAVLLRRTMGVGGTVGVSAAANVFVGMVEAPLVVKPYLARLSRGELFMVMNCGMATIAGTVLVLYAAILGARLPDALGHLLVASIVATPLALVVAALMVPGSTTEEATINLPREDASSIAAVTRGTLEGVQLLIYIVAMLLVFVALVALANAALGLLPAVAGAPLSLERMLGWLFSPLALLIGVPWHEAAVAGSLLGKKTVLNEFLAYLDLAALPPEALSERSRLLLTYALAGFANFGSLGIMLGGLGAMLPAERRNELAELGLKSVLAGLLTTCLTAAMVGLVV